MKYENSIKFGSLSKLGLASLFKEGSDFKGN